MTPYASHRRCRVLSCWCVNERSVVLLPPLLVYSILSLFSPRSPSPVYKSDVFEHFKTFKAAVETETGLKVKCLRSDGGGESLSNEFSNFLKFHGIKRQFTCRYTPQQNGVAERKNRHMAEVARALMAKKSMSKHFLS